MYNDILVYFEYIFLSQNNAIFKIVKLQRCLKIFVLYDEL